MKRLLVLILVFLLVLYMAACSDSKKENQTDNEISVSSSSVEAEKVSNEIEVLRLPVNPTNAILSTDYASVDKIVNNILAGNSGLWLLDFGRYTHEEVSKALIGSIGENPLYIIENDEVGIDVEIEPNISVTIFIYKDISGEYYVKIANKTEQLEEEEAEIRGSVATEDEIAFRQLPINYTEPLSAYPASIDTIVSSMQKMESSLHLVSFGDKSQEEIATALVSILKGGTIFVLENGEVGITVEILETGQLNDIFIYKDTAGEYYIKVHYFEVFGENTSDYERTFEDAATAIVEGTNPYNPDEFEEEFNQKFAE